MDDISKPQTKPTAFTQTPPPMPRSVDGIAPVSKTTQIPVAHEPERVDFKPASVEITPDSVATAPDPLATTVPTPSAVPIAVAESEPKETKSELIPGLNTSPSESSFDQDAVPVADTPAPDEDEKPVPDVLSAPTKPTKKSKGAAIVVAILIALALIGGAGYAYWQKHQEAQKATTNTTPVTTPAPTTPTTSTDKTTTKIDDALKKVDDTKDFQEADLSDTTLGIQ